MNTGSPTLKMIKARTHSAGHIYTNHVGIYCIYQLCTLIPICTAIDQSNIDFTFCTAQQKPIFL